MLIDPKTSSQNGFLRSLSSDDFEALRPHLRTVELTQGQFLQKIGDIAEYVYFPHSGVCSLVLELEEGESVEVAMVGREGIVGAVAAAGVPASRNGAVVVLPGAASCIDIKRLRTVAERSTALTRTLVRYGQAVLAQAQKSFACRASHPVEARLARWLLRVRDLSGSSRFTLTEDMIGQMIGARCNSVSIVGNALQQANYIRYDHGLVEITDPDGLAHAACACYSAIKAQQEDLARASEPSF